jgi:hypothetical protein
MGCIELSTSALCTARAKEVPLAIQENLDNVPGKRSVVSSVVLISRPPPCYHCLFTQESASSVLHGSRNPTSMPMPSILRKVAPPRKKVAKAPLPTPDAPTDAEDTTIESCHSGLKDGVSSAVIDTKAQERQHNVQESGEISEEATGIVVEAPNPPEDASGSIEKRDKEASMVLAADETTLISGITSELEEDDDATRQCPSPLSHHRPLKSLPTMSLDADVSSDHLNASPVLPNSQEQPGERKSVEHAPIPFSSSLPTTPTLTDSREESARKPHESEEPESESSDYGNEGLEDHGGQLSLSLPRQRVVY